jgi:hypothetical protein
VRPTRRRNFFIICFCLFIRNTILIQEGRPKRLNKPKRDVPEDSRSRRSSQSEVNALPTDLRSINTYRSQKVSNLRRNTGRRRRDGHTRHRSIKRGVNAKMLSRVIASLSFSKNRGSGGLSSINLQQRRRPEVLNRSKRTRRRRSENRRQRERVFFTTGPVAGCHVFLVGEGVVAVEKRTAGGAGECGRHFLFFGGVVWFSAWLVGSSLVW